MSSLSQLKTLTLVVADTGDFEGIIFVLFTYLEKALVLY